MANALKLSEVAHRLGISERTARRYVRSGEIPSTFIGNAYRVKEEDLEAFVETRKSNSPKAPASRKGAMQKALEELSTLGEAMHSEEVEEYLREHGASITAMHWDEFEALEDLTLPEFRQRRRALEVERDNLQDVMDGTRTSALAVLRAQSRATNWLHPEERRRLERAEELVNA